ncbi:hypothetical protein LMG31884_46220 (plasmid) [Xanthomonas hydrangeae]|nr:hypothetical protein LMG31884_46220 [Xanthomonas hydrangeae]CAD7740084.1 hypothetical protein LMG31884_46220 [Xanthomonas hydrangeae]
MRTNFIALTTLATAMSLAVMPLWAANNTAKATNLMPVQAKTPAVVTPAPDSTDGFTVVRGRSYQPPAPPTPPKVIRRWTIPPNKPLAQVLDDWARQEGWRVYWPRTDDTDLVSDIEVTFQADDFESAVTKFFAGLPHDFGLTATFNRANSPKLLNVTSSSRQQDIN